MAENQETSVTSTPTPIKRGRGRPPKVKQSVLPVNVAKTLKSDQDLSKLKNERLTTLLKATNSKYDTLDDIEYRSRIEHMNLTDLQNECMKVGLKPNVTIETKNISIGTLMDLFYENKRSFAPDESGQNKNVLSEDKRAKLLELMKNAR